MSNGQLAGTVTPNDRRGAPTTKEVIVSVKTMGGTALHHLELLPDHAAEAICQKIAAAEPSFVVGLELEAFQESKTATTQNGSSMPCVTEEA